jgi:hypothetical protein
MGTLLGALSLAAALAAAVAALTGRPAKLSTTQRATVAAGLVLMAFILLTSLFPPELGRPSYSCNGSSIGLWIETAGDRVLAQSPCVQAARRNMETVGYLLAAVAAAAGLVIRFLSARIAAGKK